jgi:hypothetical protein
VGGTISQQAVVHPWLAADAQQTNKGKEKKLNKSVNSSSGFVPWQDETVQC